MKYRLKDRELQRKLDEISDGDFSRQLASNKKRIFAELNFLKQMILWFRKSEGPFHALMITPDMLEEVREYDPRAWNDYSKVNPPEGVWMRCETDVNAIEHKIRHVAKFDGREWRDYLSKQVVVHRFRPWDNPEDEEE